MNILYFTLFAAILVLGIWLIQRTMYRHEEQKQLNELKHESQKSVSPIRLRAYERLTLLLERTTPEHMLLELQSKEPTALATWTVPQLQQYLLQTLRSEYEHNMSQQVYVSDEVWTLIINARDQMAAFIIAMASQIPPQSNAQVYATTMLTAYTSNGETPSDKALSELKDEAKSLM